MDGNSWCNLRHDFDFWKNFHPCTTLRLFCMAACSGEITIIPICCELTSASFNSIFSSYWWILHR